MICLSAEERAEIEAQIVILEARRDALNAAYLSGSVEVKMYSLDTNEGKQTTTYRSLKELQEALESTESRLNSLRRRLRGQGNTNMRLRRHGGYCGR